MTINKIYYGQYEIEAPEGASVSSLIKTTQNFFPEIKDLNYKIDNNNLIFDSTNIKGKYNNIQEVYSRIYNHVRNTSERLYNYHTNPTSEIPDPLSTIPDEEDTGGYFIEGGDFLNGGMGGMQQIPRIVGGDITQEAIDDAKNQTITMIGDSLGVGTEPSLKSFSWKQQSHNNMGSRQWSHSDADWDALLQLKNMLAANQVNQNVIMVLGTNRGVDPEEISEAINMIGDRNLILVDTKSQVPHAPEVAAAYLAASEQYSNAFYANWSQYANDGWYGSDGVHMSGEGYQKHAEFITQAVYQVMNTDWTAGFGGSFAQPVAAKFDASKSSGTHIIQTAGWSVAEIDRFRLDAADPPFMTGQFLNTWMKTNRSGGALNGHGDTMKLFADYYGISVGLAMGQWMKETEIGLNPCGGKYNLGCRMWSESSPYPKIWTKDRYWINPPSIEVAIADWFKYVRYFYMEDRGVRTYPDFLNIYAPGFENNHATFKDIMWGVTKSLGYDTSDTVSKRNYGNPNDPVHTPAFIQQVKQAAIAAQEGSAGGGGGTAVSGGGGRLTHHPITPSKGQVTMRWMGYDGHKGIDVIYTDSSSQIYAAADGVVEEILTSCPVGPRDCGGGWGNFVKIKHSNNYATRYAHLSSVNVRVGQAVRGGQQVGMMGNTGRSDGKHLHFEVLVNGERVNPETQISFAGYRG